MSVGSDNTSVGAGAIGGSFPGASSGNSGCSSEEGTQASKLVRESRSVGSFRKLSVSDELIAELTVGPAAVQLQVDEAAVSKVQTVVKGGTLEIGDGDPTRPLRTSPDARVLVAAPSLDGVAVRDAAALSGSLAGGDVALEASGSGSFHLTASVTDTLQVTTRDVGSAILEGDAKHVAVEAEGASRVISNVVAQRADVRAGGVAEVSVFASNSVRVNASGGALVTVRGNPTMRDVSTAGGAKVEFVP